MKLMLKERFSSFIFSPNLKYQILALGLAIALLYQNLYFNENIYKFQREFTFYYCLKIMNIDKDSEGNYVYNETKSVLILPYNHTLDNSTFNIK